MSIHSKLVCPSLDDHIVFTGLNVFAYFVLHNILLHIPVRDQLKHDVFKDVRNNERHMMQNLSHQNNL